MKREFERDEKFVPDYQSKCDNCDQSPCVTIVDKDGKLIQHFEMCGPCTFGEAKCIDPDEW